MLIKMGFSLDRPEISREILGFERVQAFDVNGYQRFEKNESTAQKFKGRDGTEAPGIAG